MQIHGLANANLISVFADRIKNCVVNCWRKKNYSFLIKIFEYSFLNMAMVLQKRSADFDGAEEKEPVSETFLKRRRLDPPQECQIQLKPIQGSVTVGESRGAPSILESYSTYPLRLIQQENWNKSHVTVSMLGFGGGLLAGDSVNVNITVEPNSSAW
jgi:hypothetical protein